MRKFFMLSIALCYIGVIMGQNTSVKPSLAVYVIGRNDPGEVKMMEAILVTVIVKSGKFSAKERTAAYLEKLNQEHNYQLSGAVDESKIVEYGKKDNVDYVCVVEIFDFKGATYVKARVTNLLTGDVNSSEQCRVQNKNNPDDWEKAAEDMAMLLIGAKKVDACIPKDNPAGNKVCCDGLEVVDGVCRDASSAAYWFTSNCRIEVMAKDLGNFTIYRQKYTECPAGWRRPAVEELQCMLRYAHQLNMEYKNYWAGTFTFEERGGYRKTFCYSSNGTYNCSSHSGTSNDEKTMSIRCVK